MEFKMSESVSKYIKKDAQGNDAEFANAAVLTVCANLHNPKLQSENNAKGLNIARQCRNEMTKAAKNGWIPNVTLAALALRQEPPKNTKGEDNIGSFSIKLAEAAFDTPATNAKGEVVGITSVCTVQGTTCNTKFFTKPEYDSAIVGKLKPTPEMNSNRAIPLSHSGATVVGFADALMNTDRYLNDKTLAEVVTTLRTQSTSQGAVEDTVDLCLMNRTKLANDKPLSIAECAQAGARLGLMTANDTGVRYKGGEFLGVTPQPSRIADQRQRVK
jgi:hypothetical protein